MTQLSLVLGSLLGLSHSMMNSCYYVRPNTGANLTFRPSNELSEQRHCMTQLTNMAAVTPGLSQNIFSSYFAIFIVIKKMLNILAVSAVSMLIYSKHCEI